MKFFTVLVALCAVFATSNGQYCNNIFGKSFYFYEVENLCETIASYNGQMAYWQYVFPQWEYDLQSWSDSIGPMAWSASVDQGVTYVEDVVRHVTEYRKNYTDFANSAVGANQQHKDWAAGNFSFIQTDIGLYLFEVDNALKMADMIMGSRPECGVSDRQMLIQQAISNTSTVVQNAFSNMMSSNSYLYGIINQSLLQNFIQLYSGAISDMYDPMGAIEFFELHYLEATRSLINKQLDNLTQSMMFNINAGVTVALTNQRAWLLDLLQTVETYPCYGQ